MFGRSQRPPATASGEATDENGAADMALDTLATVLRSMAEFALEQDGVDLQTFRATAEAWAKHVTLATAPPGLPNDSKPRKGRREWEGVRRFVRDYCQASSKRVIEVTADLRQVIWVFIQNLSQALRDEQENDGRVQVQLERLEQLVSASSTADLKREVLDTVAMLKGWIEERSRRQHKQVQVLGAQVRSLGHELESARKESESDPLTRIANRRAFDEYVARSVEMYMAFAQPMAMLVVDVDHFKTVNDSHGHISGDEVLRQVADALVKVFLRKSDFVSRLGGDEFAIVLRETKMADARTLAERVLGRVRALQVVGAHDEPLRVTVSIGVAQVKDGDDAKAWLDRSDRALYAAKEAGRDRVATAE
jgi:diguanylate cyclase